MLPMARFCGSTCSMETRARTESSVPVTINGQLVGQTNVDGQFNLQHPPGQVQLLVGTPERGLRVNALPIVRGEVTEVLVTLYGSQPAQSQVEHRPLDSAPNDTQASTKALGPPGQCQVAASPMKPSPHGRSDLCSRPLGNGIHPARRDLHSKLAGRNARSHSFALVIEMPDWTASDRRRSGDHSGRCSDGSRES